MPRSSEIQYFAARLADLTAGVVGASTQEELADVQRSLEETFVDVFSLLSHDALPDRPTLIARVDSGVTV